MPFSFYRHRRNLNYRLVLKSGAPYPDGMVMEDWEFTLEREDEDTGSDARAMVADMGYCLFQMGLTLKGTDFGD